MMKLFADTAELNAIQKLCAMGMIQGVTTNPIILHRAGVKLPGMIDHLCGISEIIGPNRELHAQVTDLSSVDAALKQVERFKSVRRDLCVKVPFCEVGLQLIGSYSGTMRFNVTGVVDEAQAQVALMMADDSPIDYVSLLWGRMLDSFDVKSGKPHSAIVLQRLLTVRKELAERRIGSAEGQLLVGSVRDPDDVSCLLGEGFTVTVSPNVIANATLHREGTRKILGEFEAAVQAMAKEG